MDKANVGDTPADRETGDRDVADNREDVKPVVESNNTKPIVHVPEVQPDTAGTRYKLDTAGTRYTSDTAGTQYMSDTAGAEFKSDTAGPVYQPGNAGARFTSDTAGASSKSHVDDIKFNSSLKEAEEQYCYFWKEYNPFSQWHASKFTIKDQEFCCAEQYMMYTKAVLQHDDTMAEKILKCDDPKTIKALGRKANQYSPDLWYNNCLHVVKDGNRAKFTQNEKLKESLFNTYPKILVEASPYDKRWGIGFNKHQESAWNEVTWDGLNLLGYLLTELRDELLCEATIIPAEDKKVYFDILTHKLQDSLRTMEKEAQVPYHRPKYRGDRRKHDGDFKHGRGQASSENPEPALSTSPDAWLKEPCIEKSNENNTEYKNSGATSECNIDDFIQEDNAETSTKDSSKVDDNKGGNPDNETEDLKFI